MNIKKFKIVLLSFFVTNIFADDFNIDKLLTDIKVKTDLSAKTKKENSGVYTVYTKDELRRMQVRTLKDILKIGFPYSYAENRFAISDPLTLAKLQPYNSNVFRIFIDEQEITTSLYGSGLFTLGDIDLDFVDHIEIYSKNPSYEFSAEVTFFLIKLYSKKASKDAGSKVKIEGTNYGAKRAIVHNSEELDNFSYFAYASGYIDKRKKYKSHNNTLSRDKDVSHLFASVYDKKNKLIIDVLQQKKDAFINYSFNATPKKSVIDMNSLHIGYNTDIDNLSLSINYDYLGTETHFLDDINLGYNKIDTKTSSDVISTTLKYRYITSNNKLIVGMKYRYKDFKYEELKLNNTEIERTGNTNQKVANIFVENQYSIQDNMILSVGVQASQIRNNHSIQKDDLLMYRAGYTYTNDNFTFKTIFAHMEAPLDPYLVNSYNYYITEGEKKPELSDTVSNNLIYTKGANSFELAFGMIKKYDSLLPTKDRGLLDNQNKMITIYGEFIRWKHNYNNYDKLYIHIGHTLTKNYLDLGEINRYNIVAKNINSYKKFDIFNQIIYYQDNQKSDKITIDYDAGVLYHYNDDLTFAFKGENILNKARETIFTRVDPLTGLSETPLKIPSIDQTFIISMEYLF